MPMPLDALRQLADGKRPTPPIAALIGFTLSAVSPGEAVIELVAGRQHANPMGLAQRSAQDHLPPEEFVAGGEPRPGDPRTH